VERGLWCNHTAEFVSAFTVELWEYFTVVMASLMLEG
jgi:hypothetical protein